MKALQAAGWQLDVMIHPNRSHSISGGSTTVHRFTQVADWLGERLAPAQPVS